MIGHRLCLVHFYKVGGMKKQVCLSIVILSSLLFSSSAFSCASCGCSLSSGWGSQGISSDPGVSVDFRYDYLNQNQIRSGTSRVNTWPINGHEQELYTKNKYFTATLDYNHSSDWGVSISLPYIDREHATNGMDFDGSDAGGSHTQSIGDIKIVGRYTNLTDEKNLGIQLGLKLPTGSYKKTFNSGELDGNILDRGLQPGTGTTDLILGVFKFASLSQRWDYFSQAFVQVPLNSRDDYKPGSSVNVNLGLRYMESEKIMPQIQLNLRVARKDSGEQATPDDSGGKTVYLSPGLSVVVARKWSVYGFVQAPIYQDLNGYQLAPKYIASVGTRFSF
jgi:hypothetical protein